MFNLIKSYCRWNEYPTTTPSSNQLGENQKLSPGKEKKIMVNIPHKRRNDGEGINKKRRRELNQTTN